MPYEKLIVYVTIIIICLILAWVFCRLKEIKYKYKILTSSQEYDKTDSGIQLDYVNPPPCPFVLIEMDEFTVDDHADLGLLSVKIDNLLNQIKTGKERIVAKIYLQPIVQLNTKK